jgi:hypothetical protein
MKKSFDIQELFAPASPNVMEPKLIHTPSPRELSKETKNMIRTHPGSVDLISTKQNKTNYLAS